MNKITINHDDDALDIIDKINKALSEYNIQLIDDELEHDGWITLELVPTNG